MAFTMNYGRMGMWSPKGIAKRKKKELAEQRAAKRKSIKEIAIAAMLAGGMKAEAAEAAYHRQLNALRDQRSQAGKKGRRLWKAKRKEEQRASAVKKNAIKAQGKRKPTPRTRLHYRPGMSSTDFYRCIEWQKLRYQVIEKYGNACLCCGAIGKFHVDHIKPRSKYPELALSLENLQILCEACNMGKSNLYETDWRQRGLASGPATKP